MIMIEPELPVFRNQSSQYALMRNVYRLVLDRYSYNAFYLGKQGLKKAVSWSWWMYLKSLLYIRISLFNLWKIQDKIIYNLSSNPDQPFNRCYQYIKQVNAGRKVLDFGWIMQFTSGYL